MWELANKLATIFGLMSGVITLVQFGRWLMSRSQTPVVAPAENTVRRSTAVPSPEGKLRQAPAQPTTPTPHSFSETPIPTPKPDRSFFLDGLIMMATGVMATFFSVFLIMSGNGVIISLSGFAADSLFASLVFLGVSIVVLVGLAIFAIGQMQEHRAVFSQPLNVLSGIAGIVAGVWIALSWI